MPHYVSLAPSPRAALSLCTRFGELIDWAMIILSPMEPWPGELVLDAATNHDVKLITRVVDYGGIFHDDVRARMPEIEPLPEPVPAGPPTLF